MTLFMSPQPQDRLLLLYPFIWSDSTREIPILKVGDSLWRMGRADEIEPLLFRIISFGVLADAHQHFTSHPERDRLSENPPDKDIGEGRFVTEPFA